MTPILSTITSVLGYEQEEYWMYQPAVTQGAPITSWEWSGLPPGIDYNATTGLIYGAATSTGVFLATVKATNASGSNSLVVPIGIFARSWQNDGALAIDLDLNTGQVTPLTSGYKSGGPVIYGQQDETLVIDLGFVQNNGPLIPLNPTEIKVTIKAADTEVEPLCVSDGTFEVLGTYQSTRYRVLLPLAGLALASAISDNEDDKGTVLAAVGEIRVIQPLQFNGSARSLQRSSVTFPVKIGKALQPI